MPPRYDMDISPSPRPCFFDKATDDSYGSSHSREAICAPSNRPLVANAATAAHSSPIQKKSVAFSKIVRAKKTILISSYSNRERVACWYSCAEQREMKKRTRHYANVLEKCQEQYVDFEDYVDGDECTVGLDMFGPYGCMVRDHYKQRCVRVVLDEQRIQSMEGRDNPEYIAEIYTLASQEAVIRALKVAEKV